MTEEQAKQEAVRRWGDRGYVRDRMIDAPLVRRYLVGHIVNPERSNVLVHGEGPTWDDAFKEADQRAEFLKPYMDGF